MNSRDGSAHFARLCRHMPGFIQCTINHHSCNHMLVYIDVYSEVLSMGQLGGYYHLSPRQA